MTEQTQRWPSFGYQPVGPLVNKMLARYLRTQRKNMRRFFEERGLFVFADRMRQIRKSNQGMMAKNRMFQEVLNSYATQTMPASRDVPEQMEPLHDVRQTEIARMEEKTPRASEVAVNGMASQKPRTDERDSLQISEVSDANQS
jgi:hypothetical protein